MTGRSDQTGLETGECSGDYICKLYLRNALSSVSS